MNQLAVTTNTDDIGFSRNEWIQLRIRARDGKINMQLLLCPVSSSLVHNYNDPVNSPAKLK